MPAITPIFALTETIKNPIHDGRATAGLRSLKEFVEGTRIVYRRNFKTQKVVAIGVLWGSYVHTITLTGEDSNLDRVVAAFDTAIEVAPNSYDTVMMMIDPYWSGTGVSPCLAEMVMDRMIQTGDITTAKAISLLSQADAEARR